MYKGKKFKAIILAAGSGMRMRTVTQKQYLKINEKPMVVYSLEVFEKSLIDEIVLVVKAGEEDYCQKNIIEKYGIKKVKRIIAGGDERYHSSANGLKAAKDCDYVLIHDAARPCLSADVVIRCMDLVIITGACVAGVPVIDTINKVDSDENVIETLNRNDLWSAQTPQAFQYDIICKAHQAFREKIPTMKLPEVTAITDDAKVARVFAGVKCHMVEGSYENIKVTTPSDLKIAELFLRDLSFNS